MNKRPSRSLAREFGLPRELLLECATRAHDLLVGGCFDDAIVMARGLVAADEENVYSRTLLATALFRRGDLDEAVAIIDEGLVGNSANSGLQTLRARLLAAPKPANTHARPQSATNPGLDHRTQESEAESFTSATFFRSLRC
jgi:predicted Zn-dependent protease